MRVCPNGSSRACSPRRSRQPRLIKWNPALAAELDLEAPSLDPAALAARFFRQRTAPGEVPIAMAYAGHQFGHFVRNSAMAGPS